MFSIRILVLFMQNVKFLHPIFLGKDPDKGKRNAFRPPGQKVFLPYALIIFPFAAMPQKSFKDPAPSLCIPARLPDGAWILRGGEAACPAVAEPPVRTDGATRLLTITRVRRGECHRPHALNGLSLDLLHGC